MCFFTLFTLVKIQEPTSCWSHQFNVKDWGRIWIRDSNLNRQKSVHGLFQLIQKLNEFSFFNLNSIALWLIIKPSWNLPSCFFSLLSYLKRSPTKRFIEKKRKVKAESLRFFKSFRLKTEPCPSLSSPTLYLSNIARLVLVHPSSIFRILQCKFNILRIE